MGVSNGLLPDDTDLTLCGIGTTQIWVNIGTGSGLMPDGIKLLPEPVFTFHYWGIHLRTIMQWMHNLLFCCIISLKIILLRLLTHLPGARGLIRINVVGLSLTHWSQYKMVSISQTIFSYAFSWKKTYEFRLTFHWSLFLRVKLTIF